jgi:hypothetical protein
VGPHRCRVPDRALGRHASVQEPGPLRLLQRHRADRGVIRSQDTTPAQPPWQPPAQPRHPRDRRGPDPPSTEGRRHFDRKVAEGKSNKEALRALTRQISNAVYSHLLIDSSR